MTSKEALEKLKEVSTTTYFDEWLGIIEKDLEILKLLKKYFKVYFDDETENRLESGVFSGIDLDDIWADDEDEDFNKIVE